MGQSVHLAHGWKGSILDQHLKHDTMVSLDMTGTVELPAVNSESFSHVWC